MIFVMFAKRFILYVWSTCSSFSKSFLSFYISNKSFSSLSLYLCLSLVSVFLSSIFLTSVKLKINIRMP